MITKTVINEVNNFRTPNKRTYEQNTDSNKKQQLSDSIFESTNVNDTANALERANKLTAISVTFKEIFIPEEYTSELQLPQVLSQGTPAAVNTNNPDKKSKHNEIRKNP